MTPGSDALRESLTECLTETLAEHGVPGGAVAINWDDRVVSVASGLASLRTRAAVNEQTLFRAGSITKMLVATALMKLAEAGSLRIDDRVRQHLPEFSLQDRAAAEDVTVADLLTHRGGWQGDFIDFTGENDDALALHVQNMRSLPQVVPPGRLFSYSNTGFCVLGRIVEVCAGESFENAVRHLVLEPLGITEVRFSAAETITSWFAVGHLLEDGAASVSDMWELPRCARPAGGAIATAEALAKFAAEFGRRDGYLSAETREAMRCPRADAVGAQHIGDTVGLGCFLTDLNGTQLITHTGDVNGQHALIAAVPSARFALAIMVNSEDAEPLSDSLCRWALRECLGFRLPSPEGIPSASDQARRPIAGIYESSLSKIGVSPADGDGSAQITIEPRPLHPDWPAFGSARHSAARVLANDVILLTDGPLAGSRMRVIRDKSERVAFLRAEGRLAGPAGTNPAGGEAAAAS